MNSRAAPPASNPDPDSGTWSRRLRSSGAIVLYALRQASNKKLLQIAGSLTYTTVLAIVPLLAVILALFTAFPLFAEFKAALENFLLNSLMPPSVSEMVMGYLNQFAAKASSLTAVGTIFLFITSVMLIMTIDGVLNDIWSVETQRPLRQRMLVYWAIISLGPLVAGASLWATTVLTRVSLGLVQGVSPALNVLLSVAPLVISGLAFAALFAYVPNRRVFWRDALAGGFCTAILLSLMKTGFAYYISRFPSYTVIYGAFATLPIFLLWIYLSWLGVLFGATVAATLPSLRTRRWSAERRPGAALLDAVGVLRLLRGAQRAGQPGLNTSALGAGLGAHPDDLMHVLETLHRLGLAAPTQHGDSPTDLWVLTCDPHHVPLARLSDALLFDRRQAPAMREPGLLPALAAAWTDQGTLPLQQVLHHDTLPGHGDLRQNNHTASKQHEETRHVESQ